MQSSRRTAIPCIACNQRRGVSLLELIVVVTLLSVFSAAVATRLSRDIFGDSGVRNGARLLSLTILNAQRAAILSGEPHGIEFQGSPSAANSWTLVRKLSDGTQRIVEGPIAIPQEYAVGVTAQEVYFDFEGNSMSAFSANLTGPHRKWQVEVAPLTQMISSREVQ